MEPLTIQIIAGTPATVRRLTRDLDEEGLHRRPAAGQWSMVEIVGHLIDKSEMWGERVRRMVTEDRPHLPGFDQDEYVRDRAYQQQACAPLINRLDGILTALAAYLRGLAPDAWNRVGLHEERGQLTVGEACRVFTLSMTEHAEQMLATRNAALAARAAGTA